MKLLIIDDNLPLALSLAAFFDDEGIESQIVDSAEQGKQVFSQGQFDGAVVDFYLPGADGASWIEWALKIQPDLNCVIYTGSLTLSISDRLGKRSTVQIQVYLKTHVGAADLTATFLEFKKNP